MASSAPNPYGPPPSAGPHYSHDYSQSARAQAQATSRQQQQQQQQQQQANEASAYETTTAGHQHQQQQRMDLIGGEKPLAHHSNTSLANYDAYIGGMSSDSELTTSSTAARHHHHRPYSSQSRVYHAHPVPRNTPAAASSRLSHYSSNSAANVHSPSSSNSYAIQQQQPQQQQQQQQQLQHQQVPPHNQSLSNTPPSKPIGSISHQSSVASSGGSMSSGSYLPPMMSQDSPVSPVMMRHQQQQQQQQQQARQKTGGRQLPQRPFTQSMSIDQHSQMANHYHHQPSPMSAAHSPAHSDHHQSQHSGGSGGAMPPSLHRNLTGDQLGGYQQKSFPETNQRFDPTGNLASGYNETLAQRNMRLEMDRVEIQAAAMNLYDSSSVGGGDPSSMADLPPAGSARSVSSSSSGRHLPNIGGSSSSAGGMSGPQHHHQSQLIDQHMFNQSPSQDPYTSQAQQHSGKIPDWMQAGGGGGGGGQPMSGRGGPSQFKQTMSIDHYPASRQQQQRHFTASKQGGSGGHFASTEQYHSLGHSGPYGASTTAANQLASIGSNYDANILGSPASGLHHQPPPVSPAAASAGGSAVHHQDQNLKYHQQHYSPHQSEHQLNYQTAGPSEHSQAGVHHLPNRPKLQHQPSSSSSNSNLSGSANLDKHQQQQQQQQQQQAGEHQKSSYPSASTFYPQSSSSLAAAASQHKLPPTGDHHSRGHGGRQDLLRRGHTSVTASSGLGGVGGYGAGGDFGGSQSALSESGDLSMMQTSHSSHTGRRLRAASPSAALEASSSSGPHHGGTAGGYHHHHHHSTSSGHGIRGEGSGMRSESTTGLPNGSGASGSTLTKKSNSATQLSMTGTKKRLGFRKKQVTSFSVHRSEEVAPLEARHLVKQGSSVSEGDSSMSGDSSSRSWSNSKQTPEELASMSFIDGLGKGQMISRQGLASPYLGDIQLSLCDRRGNLEIEVIRARSLQAKTNKILPLTYVKLYLVKNRKCLAKAKTTLSNKRTLNPLFQQQLTFHEDYRGCILQSIVWGNFGKMDKKNFMGIAQISIDDLELSDTVISWYKLFLPSSLQTLPSKSLRHTLLSNSTESFTTTNNS